MSASTRSSSTARTPVPRRSAPSISATRSARAAHIPRTRVSHVDLAVTSLETSLSFYRELLEPLGWTGHREVTGERGETIHYLSVEGEDPGALGLREKQSDANPVPVDRYAVGLHHICIGVSSREVVDERAAWLRERGAEVEDGPREFDYRPGYYAVFFYDPDGIKLELLHRPGVGLGPNA